MNVLGSHLRVRPTRRDDLVFLQTLWNDGTVMRPKGYADGMHVTADGMEQWWAMTPQAQSPNALFSPLMCPHCVIERLDGTLVGEISYSLDTHQRVLLDLKFSSSCTEPLLAGEAVALFLREVFAATPAVAVIVEPSATDMAAQDLFRTCGFQPAATENHPTRWVCERTNFAHSNSALLAGAG